VSLAVVIPTLNEAANIEATLAAVLAETGVEATVVDGGSSDGTPDLAARAGARVLAVTGGRAAQLNTGAAATIADQLLFLHADTRLPAGWPAAVHDTLADPAVALGAFALAIDGATAAERLVAAGATWRSRSWGLPYGDQALFLRRATFERLGGFAPLPIMEDWDLARRARALGAIRVHGLAVVTSPRRWRRLGVARTLIRNQMMHVGWRLGIAPDRLAAFYRR
jgi:rSAM/selenodomain-associated transferase 2